jgi:hypothetical protein
MHLELEKENGIMSGRTERQAMSAAGAILRLLRTSNTN